MNPSLNSVGNKVRSLHQQSEMGKSLREGQLSISELAATKISFPFSNLSSISMIEVYHSRLDYPFSLLGFSRRDKTRPIAPPFLTHFSPFSNHLFPLIYSSSGSGSTYIYGYCDATWKEGMTKEQTLEFVKNALSLAMRRDGSSGGTIRMANIDESGVERHFVPGVSISLL